MPTALDKNTILENLKIEQLLNDNQNLYRVVKTIEFYFFLQRKKVLIRNYVQRN